jgi:serine/threonine protein kinase
VWLHDTRRYLSAGASDLLPGSAVEHHDPVDAADAPFRKGFVLDGRFVITEVLSRSGMGTILKAEDKQNGNRLVAVKVPHLEYESDPNFFRVSSAKSGSAWS